MKKLLIMAILVVPNWAKADCCNVKCEQKPKQKPKIVTKTKVVEKPVIVTKEVVKVVEKPMPYVVTKQKIMYRKNRISVVGGAGPTKMLVSHNEAKLKRGTVIGVQYQRMVTDSLSLGVQALSNETILGSVGIDF